MDTVELSPGSTLGRVLGSALFSHDPAEKHRDPVSAEWAMEEERTVGGRVTSALKQASPSSRTGGHQHEVQT